MYRSLPLLALALAGCLSREIPVTIEDVNDVSAIVRYEVDGTHPACTITHTDPEDGAVTREAVPLPWAKEFRVTVNDRTGAFEALVRATCSTPGMRGKSTSAVLIDGVRKRQGSAEGPGETSEARFRVGIDS